MYYTPDTPYHLFPAVVTSLMTFMSIWVNGQLCLLSLCSYNKQGIPINIVLPYSNLKINNDDTKVQILIPLSAPSTAHKKLKEQNRIQTDISIVTTG
jgi:hypothetical protein